LKSRRRVNSDVIPLRFFENQRAALGLVILVNRAAQRRLGISALGWFAERRACALRRTVLKNPLQ